MTNDEPFDEHASYHGELAAHSGRPSDGAFAAAQPPGYGSSPFLGGDIVAAGPDAPKRRLAPVITSVIAVLAIVLAGGAFTAYKLLASTGGQPDAWAPANSIGFAKLDLDPSASAKVAAWEFEKKFPDAPKIASADDLKDALLKTAFKNASGADDSADYDRDIKPWLGNRVAVAAFVDSAGKPQAIGILEVKDAAKARAGLGKLSPGQPAYSIQGGYAVIGDTQQIVDEAVASARKASIAGNSAYSSDIAHLKTDRIVTAWWDAGATLKAFSGELPGNAGALLMSGGLTGLPDMSKAGRLVMGLRVQPSSVEIEGRVLGSSTSSPAVQLKNGDAGSTLAKLPGGSVAGFALSNPEQIVKAELDSLKSGVLGAGLQNQLDAVGAQLGMSLPGDLENLLGSELAVGLDAAPAVGTGLGSALFTVLTHPDDLAKGLRTAQMLAATATTASGDPKLSLTASARGSSVVITNNARPSTGKLADDPTFKAALDGMPSQAAMAGFVNLSALVAASPHAPADAAHLDGVGFYFGADSTSPVFSVKLTVK